MSFAVYQTMRKATIQNRHKECLKGSSSWLFNILVLITRLAQIICNSGKHGRRIDRRAKYDLQDGYFALSGLSTS